MNRAPEALAQNPSTGRRADTIRVLHVIANLEVGGAENLVVRFVTTMDPRRFTSSVCCLQTRGHLGRQLVVSGHTVFELGVSPGFRKETIRRLRSVIREERIDVIHAHTYTPFFFSALARLGLPGTRLIFTEHGRLFPERPRLKRQLINPLLAHLADRIVSISESTRCAMSRIDNFPHERIGVILNGVDVEPGVSTGHREAYRRSLGLDGTTDVLVMAARLVQLKNIPMALAALREVLRVRPGTILLVAGDGPERDVLESRARQLGIASQVRFLGMRGDLASIFCASDLFLLSSETEGISLTLLEAMSYGLAAVATAVGGNPEVVRDGESGILVRSGDSAAMASAILRLLQSPDLRSKMGRSGSRRARDVFSFETMLRRYETLYQGACEA